MIDIAIVGEAYGQQEELVDKPFIGSSGQELTRMLGEAGINRGDCFLTNVFNKRPPGNEINHFLTKKARSGDFIKAVKPEYLEEVFRLERELTGLSPNIIVTVGAISTWALTGEPKISVARGTVHASNIQHVSGWPVKVLPTYHPAAVMRQWSLRPIVVCDLIKAKKEAKFPEIRRPKREIIIEPTLKEIERFIKYKVYETRRFAFDIETKNGQILCISLASSLGDAIVIPFVDRRKSGYSYWPTPDEEVEAWHLVQGVLEDPSLEKVAQNGLYDIQWLLVRMGIKVMNFLHDTMILHHSLQPELPKGLGFLGSIYTNEKNWKEMRKKVTETKRDD